MVIPAAAGAFHDKVSTRAIGRTEEVARRTLREARGGRPDRCNCEHLLSLG